MMVEHAEVVQNACACCWVTPDIELLEMTAWKLGLSHKHSVMLFRTVFNCCGDGPPDEPP
jgi:hypothetical protein